MVLSVADKLFVIHHFYHGCIFQSEASISSFSHLGLSQYVIRKPSGEDLIKTHRLNTLKDGWRTWNHEKKNATFVIVIKNITQPVLYFSDMKIIHPFSPNIHSFIHSFISEMPTSNFWGSRGSDGVEEEEEEYGYWGSIRRKGPSSVYQFFKATARRIKMDGGIDMTTPWQTLQVAPPVLEAVLRNGSVQQRWLHL